MTCPTCNDYELVDDGSGHLASCPDCRPRPDGFVACLVHNARVAVSKTGRILGRCDGCQAEAARGIRWLRDNPVEAQEVLMAAARDAKGRT